MSMDRDITANLVPKVDQQELNKAINDIGKLQEAGQVATAAQVPQISGATGGGGAAIAEIGEANNALIEQIEELGKVRRFELEALASTTEENQKRLQAIENERNILLEQIKLIKDSGNTSEQAQVQLKQLNDQMGFLGQQTTVLSSENVKLAQVQNDQGKKARVAQTGIRAAGDALGFLGGEAGATAASVVAMAAPLPPLIAGVNGATVSFLGLEVAVLPFIAAAAAAVAIIGGVTFVLANEYNKAMEEQSEVVNRAKDVQIAYNEALTLTSDTIEDQIIANERLIETNRANQEATQRAIDDLNEKGGLGFLGGILFDIGDGFGLVGDEGDKLADELKGLEEKEQELVTSTEGLTEALGSAEVAANDARQALLESVEQERNLSKFRREALEGDAEANQKRLDAINAQRDDIQKSIATLQASGDTSKEVTNEIESLNQELGNLDSQAQILGSSAVKTAEAQKAQAAATEELGDALEESQAQLNAAISERNKVAREGAQELANIANESAAELSQLQREGQQEFAELFTEQQQDEIDAEQEKQRTLAKLRSDFADEERGEATRFKFLDAAETRKDAAKSLSEEEAAVAERRTIRLAEDVQERADLVAGIEQEREIKEAEREAELERAAIELQQDIMAADEKQRALISKTNEINNDLLTAEGKAGQQRVELASQVGQAQVDIMSQVVAASQQAAAAIQQSLGSVGSTTNNFGDQSFSFANGANNLAQSNLSPAQQGIVAGMIQMAKGL